MKYSKSKCFILCIVLMSSSCKKLVEVDPPKTSLVTETVFQTNDQATAAVTGIYSALRAGGFASGSQTGISVIGGNSSDEFISYSSLYDLYYENELTPYLHTLSGLFNEPFKTIFTANVILEGLSFSQDVTTPVKLQLEGEALFIRAFANFYLVNMFGEIPLQLTSDYRITSRASKASVNEIYQQIIADLKQAEYKLGETYPTTQRVRPNKSAAQAMLARTYLYIEDWENAEKYSSLVIGKTDLYELVDFNSVFLMDSKEAIWQIHPELNTNAVEANTFVPGSFTIPPGLISLRSSFVQSTFQADDKRKDEWIKSYTISAGTYYYPFKYKVRSSTVATEYSTVLRLAEQLLIRAEARINSGKIALGIDDLNKVRTRPLANGSNSNTLGSLPVTLNKTEALLAAEQERKAELFAEWAHRWFDLKRTGKATQVLTPLKPHWQPTDVLYPIPDHEIRANPNITQNPGY